MHRACLVPARMLARVQSTTLTAQPNFGFTLSPTTGHSCHGFDELAEAFRALRALEPGEYFGRSKQLLYAHAMVQPRYFPPTLHQHHPRPYSAIYSSDPPRLELTDSAGQAVRAGGLRPRGLRVPLFANAALHRTWPGASSSWNRLWSPRTMERRGRLLTWRSGGTACHCCPERGSAGA